MYANKSHVQKQPIKTYINCRQTSNKIDKVNHNDLKYFDQQYQFRSLFLKVTPYSVVEDLNLLQTSLCM